MKELPHSETPVITRDEAPSPTKIRPAITLQTQPNLQPAMLDLSTLESHDTKLKKRFVDVIQQVATSDDLLNGIEPSSIFVK